MATEVDKMIIVRPEDIPHHPLASKHRNMSDMEFESHKQSIEINQQTYPVILYRGKLVDGRHRQRALIELGIHDMKAIELPNNMSLKQVEETVMGTEMRRSDSVAQRAIRGYRWYLDNADNATQQASATKFGVGKEDISRAKKLYNAVGKDTFDLLYNRGFLVINDRRYTTIQSILKALIADPSTPPPNREPLSDKAEAIKDLLYEMLDDSDIAGIAYSEAVAKKLRMKDV